MGAAITAAQLMSITRMKSILSKYRQFCHSVSRFELLETLHVSLKKSGLIISLGFHALFISTAKHRDLLGCIAFDQDDERVGDRHGSGVLEPDAALLVPGGATSPGAPRRDLADPALEEGVQVHRGRAVVEFVERRNQNVEQGLVS